MLGVALHERAALVQASRRLRQERFGEVDPESLRRGDLGEKVSGAAADFQDPIAGPWGEQGKDATDALAFDVPNERARVVVKLLDVVLLHHRVVPRLELAKVPKVARAHCRVTCLGRV